MSGVCVYVYVCVCWDEVCVRTLIFVRVPWCVPGDDIVCLCVFHRDKERERGRENEKVFKKHVCLCCDS